MRQRQYSYFGRVFLLTVTYVTTVVAAVVAQGTREIPGLPGELEVQLKARHAIDETQTSSSAEPRGTEGNTEGKTEGHEAVKSKSWKEIVEQWMTPMRVNKSNIVRIDDNYAYPHPAVPLKMEIVKEDEEYVWLKGLPPEDPESALHQAWMKRQEDQVQILLKREYDEEYGPGEFLDFSMPSIPPPTIHAVDFVPAGDGLPKGGKWQMGFDMADFNGDGIDDIVLPPARLGTTRHPTIYLGDGKGDFKYWNEAKWNPQVGFDYGDVETGDFDQDGYLDIVIAVHFKSQYILYGSKNHEFRRFEKLPSPDPRVTSRAVTVADFNRDGRLDVAFLAELDLDLSDSKRLKESPTVWIVHNTEKGWKLDSNAITHFVFGDVLRTADLDGNGWPDLVLASNMTAWRAIVFFNQGADRWTTLDERHVLGNAFYFSVAPVPSTSPEQPPVLYAAFEQFMRYRGKQQARTGIVRFVPNESDWSSIEYSTIFFDDQRGAPYFRIAVGDVSGDGLDDIVTARKTGGIEVWIQTVDGDFYLNPSSALKDGIGLAYDLMVADVDHDGIGDIVAAMADLNKDLLGGVRVWLSRASD